MTEETLKHELYKHGSYLISLKESGSSFVNIDDEIKKNEELLQLASKKDKQPTFVVGEYYSATYFSKGYNTDTTFIFKVLEINDGTIKVLELDTYLNALKEGAFNLDSTFAKECKPATAEQIATFKRAEHFASKGRELDEFRAGDKVMISDDKVIAGPLYVDGFENGYVVIALNGGCYYDPDYPGLTLIQTAEELQEVGENE